MPAAAEIRPSAREVTGVQRIEQPPDERLAKAQQGDRAAAGEILRELLPRIRNLVRYLTKGDSDVDDMAQRAMLAILKGLPGFRAEGSLNAWADRITVRETLSYVKRARSERGARDAAAPALRLAQTPGPAPDAGLTRDAALGLLDGMPAEQSDIVVLHHIVGMSLPEVAAQLGVPFETCRSRLRLAMKKLRLRAAEEGVTQ